MPIITIDIPKAKEIRKEQLRQERKPLLEQLDVDYMRAQEAGDITSSIVQKKQRLRDITNAVDSCTTVEDLKAINCEI
jgi:hypothetical protein